MHTCQNSESWCVSNCADGMQISVQVSHQDFQIVFVRSQHHFIRNSFPVVVQVSGVNEFEHDVDTGWAQVAYYHGPSFSFLHWSIQHLLEYDASCPQYLLVDLNTE